jgi:hypothetical protein
VVVGAREGEHNQNLNFAISLSAIKGATPRAVKPERLPTRQPETTPPTSSGGEAAFHAKVQRIKQLCWAIADKYRALGEWKLADEALQIAKVALDAEQIPHPDGWLDVWNQRASDTIRQLQYRYDHLKAQSPADP